ncbi:unnamed protein product [Hymenolepis diminuta]|uniref:PH domain-containing protein n=1 Tax=Hymenolepis diminuta TaxID=6216 RepID=A0A158QFQ4_HYMDI|nr:unnamed protein product [Hymenolepis diminuta]
MYILFSGQESKSTVCLAQETRFDPMYSSGVYASHPNKLDSIFNDKSKLSRRLSKQRKTGIPTTVNRSFSLSRFFRRTSKSRDLLNENSEDVNPYRAEPPTLGRIYLTSSINFDSGSWTSLLEDQPRQSTRLLSTPTQSSSRNLASKAEQATNAAILRPKSEQVNNEPNRIGPSLMLNSVYLENSSSDIFIEEPGTPSSTEPLVLQKRRKALRSRLLSRSQQPLTDPSSQNPPERFEIDIKGRGLEVGKIHSSLVGGRKNCFFIKMPTSDTRIFAAASQGERKCWLTR